MLTWCSTSFYVFRNELDNGHSGQFVNVCRKLPAGSSAFCAIGWDLGASAALILSAGFLWVFSGSAPYLVSGPPRATDIIMFGLNSIVIAAL